MRFVVLVLSLTGCAAATEVRPLTVYPVEWNIQKVPLGKVAAVAESGDDVTVFGSLGALSFTGGAPVAADGTVREWRSAATIPAADGPGSWMVGLDARGRLYRVRARASLESISGRFGLENVPIRAFSDLGRGRIAFTLAAGLAIADGDRVARFDYPFTVIAGGDGRGAGITSSGARVFDPFRGVDKTFSLSGLRNIAIASDGHVIVANKRAVWREDDAGHLVLRYRSEAESIGGVVTSGDNVWFADGAELGLVTASFVARTTGMKTRASTLVGSKTGDVWAVDDAGKLTRFSTARAAGVWQTTIAGIHARVCAGCHGPGGSAGLDLSGAARWQASRAAIDKRVVKDGTMPPPGHPLTTAEREAIARWSASP